MSSWIAIVASLVPVVVRGNSVWVAYIAFRTPALPRGGETIYDLAQLTVSHHGDGELDRLPMPN